LTYSPNPDLSAVVDCQSLDGRSSRNADVFPALAVVLQNQIVISEQHQTLPILDSGPVLVVRSIFPGTEKPVQRATKLKDLLGFVGACGAQNSQKKETANN
jgi:hypothetical protein